MTLIFPPLINNFSVPTSQKRSFGSNGAGSYGCPCVTETHGIFTQLQRGRGARNRITVMEDAQGVPVYEDE